MTNYYIFYQKHIHYFCKKNILKLKKHEFDFIPNKTFICTSGKCNDEVSLENSKWCRDIFFFTENLQIFWFFLKVGPEWISRNVGGFILGFASMNIFGSISFFFRPCKPKQRNVSVTSEETFTFFGRISCKIYKSWIFCLTVIYLFYFVLGEGSEIFFSSPTRKNFWNQIFPV